jgi:hypothetical protein
MGQKVEITFPDMRGKEHFSVEGGPKKVQVWAFWNAQLTESYRMLELLQLLWD